MKRSFLKIRFIFAMIIGFAILLIIIFASNFSKKETLRVLYNGEYVNFLCGGADTCVIVIPGYWDVNAIRMEALNGEFVQPGNEVTFVKCKTNIMYIFLDDEGFDRVREDKHHKEKGRILVKDKNGNVEYEGKVSIHGRGNGSWRIDKKSYKIKIGRRMSLLGLPASKKYNLIANHDDTNLRNHIAYEIARRINTDYPISDDFVQLYVNGDYQGLYLITNTVTVDSTSVNIGDSGFILDHALEYDSIDSEDVFSAKSGVKVEVKFPKIMTSEDRLYITSIYNSMEDAITSPHETHYTNYIDIESFARYYLVQEVLLNYDGGRGSMLLYKSDRTDSSKIHAGPIWDMELSMFNPYQRQEAMSPYIIYVGSEYKNIPSDYKGLFPELCRHSDFMNEVKSIYKTEMINILDFVFDIYIDSIAPIMEQDVYADCIRWGRSFSYYEEISKIKHLMKQRVCFLNEIWSNSDTIYSNVIVDPGWIKQFIYQTSTYKVKKGNEFRIPLYGKYQYGSDYKCVGVYEKGGIIGQTIDVKEDTIHLRFEWKKQDVSLGQKIENFIKYRLSFLY